MTFQYVFGFQTFQFSTPDGRASYDPEFDFLFRTYVTPTLP